MQEPPNEGLAQKPARSEHLSAPLRRTDSLKTLFNGLSRGREPHSLFSGVPSTWLQLRNERGTMTELLTSVFFFCFLFFLLVCIWYY